MDKEKLDTIFRLGILLAVLLMASSIAYYFVFYLPDRDARKDTQQRTEKELRDLNYSGCLATADANYSASWAAACKSQGHPSPDCTLQWGQGDKINKSYEDDKNRCLKEAENGLNKE